jgi:hypothetical protein
MKDTKLKSILNVSLYGFIILLLLLSSITTIDALVIIILALLASLAVLVLEFLSGNIKEQIKSKKGIDLLFFILMVSIAGLLLISLLTIIINRVIQGAITTRMNSGDVVFYVNSSTYRGQINAMLFFSRLNSFVSTLFHLGLGAQSLLAVNYLLNTPKKEVVESQKAPEEETKSEE